MGHSAFLVSSGGNSCEIGEPDLMAQLCLVGVFVNGEDCWAEDELYGSPCLEELSGAMFFF